MNKKLFFALVILFFSFNLIAQTSTSPAKVQHRVVIQLSSNDTLVWKGLNEQY